MYILDLGHKKYQIKSMSTYNEVLSQVQSLTSDEQLRLLEELAALVRRKVISEHLHRLPEIQRVSKDKWRGFLPKRVDALEFQRALRQEWGE
jgi:dihydroneopterin aldolase